MNTPHGLKEHGFTLIEVLVSIVILSTGIILVLGAMETSASALSAARTMSRAVFLCEHQLAAMTLARELGEGQTLNNDSGAFRPPFEKYRWTREITADEGAAEVMARSRQVRVSISRDGSDATDLQFTTLMAE